MQQLGHHEELIGTPVEYCSAWRVNSAAPELMYIE
jgi:hypothetical protein